MARNARLWQNPLAHVRQFEGDEALCNQWYGWAQQKLGFMLKSTPGPTSQVFYPVVDVMIKIDTRPNRITIKSGAFLYLETGFYVFDPIPYSATDIAIGTGANCYYNSFVTSQLAGDTPDQGRINIRSKFLGEAFLDGEDLDSGFRSRSFIYSFQDPDRKTNLLRKYRAMTRVPASVFSGKMKLLVQAKYGSKDLSMYYPDGLPYEMPILSWGSETLSALAKGSVQSALFTTSNFEYFLMQIGSNHIRFIKLKFNTKAELIRKALQDNVLGAVSRVNKLSVKAEAVLLSTAEFELDENGNLVEYLASYYPVPGFFMYYGWNFNWRGSEAEGIVHAIDVVDNYASYYTRHVKLQISCIKLETGYAFTVTSSTLSNNLWWPSRNWFALCYPFPGLKKLLNGLYYDLYLSNELGYDQHDMWGQYSDIPVYLIRDNSDQVQLVTISQNLEYKNTTEYYGGQWFPVNEKVSNSGYKRFLGTLGSVSINCAGISKSGTYSSYGISSWQDVEAATVSQFDGAGSRSISYVIGGYPNTDYGSNVGYLVGSGHFTQAGPTSNIIGESTGEFITIDDKTSEIFYAVRFANGPATAIYNNIDLDTYDVPNICLVIPYDSCDSAMVVWQQINGAKNETIRTRSNVYNYLYAGMQIVKSYFHPVTNVWTLHQIVSTASGMMRSISGNITIWDTTEYINTPGSVVGDMTAKAQGDTVSIGSKTVGIYDYFNFSLIDPYVESPDSIRTAVNGGVVYAAGYLGSMTEVSVDYPGTIAVGWA